MKTDYWFEYIERKRNKEIKVVLVGNKSDLNNERLIL